MKKISHISFPSGKLVFARADITRSANFAKNMHGPRLKHITEIQLNNYSKY